MGTFHAAVRVGNPDGPRRAVLVSALVDTGAAYTVMPAALLTRLGIIPAESGHRFRLADGQRVEYDMGNALLIIGDRMKVCAVVFGRDGQFLLGANALELFQLLVNPFNERLEPMYDLHEPDF